MDDLKDVYSLVAQVVQLDTTRLVHGAGGRPAGGRVVQPLSEVSRDKTVHIRAVLFL